MENNQPAPTLRPQAAAWKPFGDKSRKPLIEVVASEQHPGLWRINWPDAGLSDLVNLTRAKDAASLWAMAQVPGGRRDRLHWRKG